MHLEPQELTRNDQVINSRVFRLLDLPPELRNKIYACIIYKFERKSKQIRATKHIAGVFAQLPRLIVSFLLTCKTIWRELLSLLFGSYIWSADLRLQNIDPGFMTIYPADSWLLKPSTLARPTSENIRHVRFRMEHKIPQSYSRLSRGHTRHVHFIITISLKRTIPNYEMTVLSSVLSAMPLRDILVQKSNSLKRHLELEVESLLQKLIVGKKESNERVTNVTLEEWREMVSGLKLAYLAWVRSQNWSSKGD